MFYNSKNLMFIVARVLIASVLVSWLSHVTWGKKILHSIKDCNQQTVGVIDCRYQGWQTIPYDVFDFPVGKNSIKLGGNPYVCDCRLTWFYRESPFQSRNKNIIKDLYEQRLKCGSPSRNKGAYLSDLNEGHICPRKQKFFREHFCKEFWNVLHCDNVKRTLPDNIFETKMKKISLKRFGYHCDCNLVWFIRKLKQKKYKSRLLNPSNIGKCIYPKRLMNKKLQDLTEEDVCPQLPRIEVDACKSYPHPCDRLFTKCKKEKFTFKCEDINECAEWKYYCNPKTTNCINLSPGYECECKDGFSGKTPPCRDINECLTKDRCGKNAKCKNLPGSYECKCNAGFIGKGKVCFDVNECLRKGTCAKDAKCINTPGSYSCTCNSGFEGDGKECKDIDECQDKKTCSTNAHCSNSQGSYLCQCKKGFTGNGKICRDIDECSSDQHTCHRDANCINTSPGYQCHCKSGYRNLKDGRLCEDVDECERKTYCAKKARCENTPGSFKCVCESGYYGNGKYCDDINECEDSDQCSSIHAKCENTDGSYKCTCNTGFYGNGKICKDIDECSNEGVCLMANSICINTPGSYQCQCIEGFSKNETHCSDIDECKELSHNCDINAKCINYPGGYKCECKEGYERFMEAEPCFKEENLTPFYEDINVRIAAPVASVMLLVVIVISCCCCKRCCGRKKESSSKKTDESEEPLLYGADMPFVPMNMSPMSNISMVSAYSEKQDFDFDYYDNE